jgi:hypothetical protein
MSAEMIAVAMRFQAHMPGDIVFSFRPMEMGRGRCCFRGPETIADIFDFRRGDTRFETRRIGLGFGCTETAHFRSNFDSLEIQAETIGFRWPEICLRVIVRSAAAHRQFIVIW